MVTISTAPTATAFSQDFFFSFLVESERVRQFLPAIVSPDHPPDPKCSRPRSVWFEYYLSVMPATEGFFHGQLPVYTITCAMAGIFEL